MFKEGKRKSQREPKRNPLAAVAAIFLIGGVILSITIIGAIVGIPMIVIGLIVLFVRSRIKSVSVPCGSCGVPNKIELNVPHFNCSQCNHTNIVSLPRETGVQA